jgi:hypothetical protein
VELLNYVAIKGKAILYSLFRGFLKEQVPFVFNQQGIKMIVPQTEKIVSDKGLFEVS